MIKQYAATVAMADTALKANLAILFRDRPADREIARAHLQDALTLLSHSLAAWIGNAADREFGPTYGPATVRLATLGELARQYEAAAAALTDLHSLWCRGHYPRPNPTKEQHR